MAVPYYPKCDSQVEGVMFSVHDTVIQYRGLSILQIEKRDAAHPPNDPGACDIPEFVCCFADRLYIPGEGSYVVRTDGDKVQQILEAVRALTGELGTVIELLSRETIDAVVACTPGTIDFIAEAVSHALHARRRGVAPADAATSSVFMVPAEGVSHELACVVGLFTSLCLVSDDALFGVDVVLGATKLVHVDTGEPLPLFTRSPKW